MKTIIRDLIAFPLVGIAFMFLWLAIKVGGKGTAKNLLEALQGK
jgi:hypothetical protein